MLLTDEITFYGQVVRVAFMLLSLASLTRIAMERRSVQTKHRWSEAHKDARAYVPADITALVSDPVAVWQQCYTESNIKHSGVMQQSTQRQKEQF